jgi:hypothetical protein
MHLRTSSLAFVFVLALSLPVFAAKDADLKPISAKPGKVMAEDAFTSAEIAKTWTAAKGDVAIKDGALVETFKASDNHPAVLMLAVPNHNAIIKFSFKMEDATKGFALSYNTPSAHLFRVLVTGDGLSVVKDAEKEKGAKPKGKGKAGSEPTKTAAAAPAAKGEAKAKGRAANGIAKAEGKISAGEWHTMLVEVQGTKVAVQTDTGLKAEGTHPEIDVDKTGYRFVTAASVSIDDVKVWSAE